MLKRYTFKILIPFSQLNTLLMVSKVANRSLFYIFQVVPAVTCGVLLGLQQEVKVTWLMVLGILTSLKTLIFVFRDNVWWVTFLYVIFCHICVYFSISFSFSFLLKINWLLSKSKTFFTQLFSILTFAPL
jgi:hypothetical protein